jgi:hypothetical protein
MAGDGGGGGDESCEASAVVIASEQPASSTSRIAIDDADAYWTYGIMVFDGPAEGNGSVTKAPLAGGAATAVASEQGVPAAIALNENDVFWIDQFWGKIMKAPKSGGTPTEVVSSFNGNILELEVDDDSVYWVDYDEGGPGVFKAPVGAGTAVRLATGVGQIGALAVDETHVYWSQYVQGEAWNHVMKAPIEGGEPEIVHGQLYGSVYSDLAVGASNVYWNGDRGTDVGADGTVSIKLMQIPLAGGAPVTIAEESGISQLAVNSTAVYFTVQLLDGRPGAIRKVPLNGGSVSTVVSEQPGLSAFAVDDAHVCWLNFPNNSNDGEVRCLETCEDGS